MLRRGPGSENSIPPSTATKVITSGRAVADIDRTAFSIARSREPSSLFLPDEEVLPTKMSGQLLPPRTRVEASTEGMHTYW